jgi:hypothetical protein
VVADFQAGLQLCLLLVICALCRFLFVLVVPRGWTKGFMVDRQVCHAPNRFYLSCFWNKVLHFWIVQLGLWFSYLYFLCSWGDRCIPPYPGISWDGILLTFCPDWPWTVILLISTYQVSGITAMSHCTWPSVVFNYVNRALSQFWGKLTSMLQSGSPGKESTMRTDDSNQYHLTCHKDEQSWQQVL